MNKTSVKTYGVRDGHNHEKVRYFVVCNGRTTRLHYANKEFALSKALEFCKSCYVDFTRLDNVEVRYIFKHVR